VVRYESYDEVESRPNASPKENKPAPVIGRSYRIERGDSLRVRAEDPGKGISEGERSFLAAAYGRMDGRMRFGAVLRGRSLAIGDSLLLDREAAGPIFTDMKGANDVRSFKLYFQEIRRDRGGDCALFRAAILLGGNSGPLEMSMELTGTILVGISDGRLYALELAGPVQARSVNSDLPITGRGMISTRRSVQYNAH
jgi:hypothetical protein